MPVFSWKNPAYVDRKRQVKVTYMKVKTRIKEIALEKFGLEVKPTPVLLKKLNTNPHRFRQIMDNKGVKEIDAEELHRFSEWLRVPIQELFEKPKENTFHHA